MVKIPLEYKLVRRNWNSEKRDFDETVRTLSITVEDGCVVIPDEALIDVALDVVQLRENRKLYDEVEEFINAY